MRRARHIGWRCGLVLLLLAAGCQRRAGTATMEDVLAEGGPDQESWGVHFYVSEVPIGSDESRMRLEMTAAYMAQYESKDSTYMLLHSPPDTLGPRVTALIFDAFGEAAATLTADRVFYFETEKRFEAQGNVVVVARDERRLESEHLLWFEDERKIRTPGFVRIVTPSEQVQGYGLVADEDLETYEIRRIRAKMRIEEEEQ